VERAYAFTHGVRACVRARARVCVFVSIYVFICVHVASGKYCTLRKSKRRVTDPNYASASGGEITLNAL